MALFRVFITVRCVDLAAVRDEIASAELEDEVTYDELQRTCTVVIDDEHRFASNRKRLAAKGIPYFGTYEKLGAKETAMARFYSSGSGSEEERDGIAGQFFVPIAEDGTVSSKDLGAFAYFLLGEMQARFIVNGAMPPDTRGCILGGTYEEDAESFTQPTAAR